MLVQFETGRLLFAGSAGALARSEREARRSAQRRSLLVLRKRFRACGAVRARAPALPVITSLITETEPLRKRDINKNSEPAKAGDINQSQISRSSYSISCFTIRTAYPQLALWATDITACYAGFASKI